MSNRGWTIWLRPPIVPVAGLPLILACVLVGCAGGRPLASVSQGPSGAAPASVAPPSSGQPLGARLQAADLTGKSWLAEGPRGWEAGRIGGRSIALARGEVGIAAGGPWIISAILRPTDSVKLLLRSNLDAQPTRIDLGPLAPTATVVVGDHAYVSGFSFAEPTDPGILEIDLLTGMRRALLPPSDAVGTRYLAVSLDGATVVSSLCDQLSDPEPETCFMTVLSLADGTTTTLGDVRGGLPRATSSEVAVVAPQSHEPAGWLAGIDLRTGTQLWSLAGGEFGEFVMNAQHGLIQQRTRIDGPTPRLLIEAIDLRSGATHVVYEEARAAPGALWPALSSDRFIVVGDDATGSRALGASANAHARVRLVPLDGGDPLDVPISLRSES